MITQRKGMTLVPMVMYFNHRGGMAKDQDRIAKGKKTGTNKARNCRQRDWSRQNQRPLLEKTTADACTNWRLLLLKLVTPYSFFGLCCMCTATLLLAAARRGRH